MWRVRARVERGDGAASIFYLLCQIYYVDQSFVTQIKLRNHESLAFLTQSASIFQKHIKVYSYLA
jgi:hypothetical protein